uniref:Uncharacterized protein n=1 Tax=Arundo donax TaxID=35708 RepID=A0A0A8YYX2_ARUDO
MMGLECCLVLVCSNQTDLMVTCAHVELCEPSCTSQLIKKFFHHQHRIFVLNCDCIQLSIIHTKLPAAIFFFD